MILHDPMKHVGSPGESEDKSVRKPIRYNLTSSEYLVFLALLIQLIY